MPYNAGYVDSNGYNAGYVGDYEGGNTLFPYSLLTHGTPEQNSLISPDAKFATTGEVRFGIVSDFPSAQLVVDWQAISDGDLWLQDINTLDAVTVNATEDVIVSATIRYQVVETGEEGQYTITANIIATSDVVVDSDPDAFTVAALVDQPLDQYVEFAPITVSGIDPGVSIPVTVSGPNVQYAVDAGSGFGGFTATSTDVEVGFIVKPRILTSDQNETERTGSISIGNQSSTLSATTEATDTMPVIEIENVNTTISVGDVWTNPNYTATDVEDGDITSDVVVTGAVDPNTAGDYTLTYEVADADGNTVTETLTVSVVDTIEGTIDISNIETTSDGFTAAYTYTGADVVDIQYSVNNGSWYTTTGGTISHTGLPQGRLYRIRTRINKSGLLAYVDNIKLFTLKSGDTPFSLTKEEADKVSRAIEGLSVGSSSPKSLKGSIFDV